MANPPSRKDAWKAAAASKASAQPVDQAWRNAREQTVQHPPWWKARWARLSFVTFALLAVSVLTYVVVRMLHPPKPIHLVLVGAGYEDNLAVPPNVVGKKGLDGLLQLADSQDKWGGQVTSVELDKDADTVKRALDVSFGQKAPKKVVFFLSAHGVADVESGFVPCLTPTDDDLSKRSTLYQLDNLLDVLAAQPPEQQKLLLVDATQLRAYWPLGELHNDFFRALESRREKIKSIPHLLVLTSSDKDQRSWVSPEWGTTVFAHYVTEGLRGAADGTNGQVRNARVDVGELYRYVHEKVKSWTRHNRHQLQTPVLFGTEEEAAQMELVSCGDYTPESGADTVGEPPSQETYSPLKKAWSDCRKLDRESPHPAVYTPHLWRRYLDTLLRAEHMLRAGDTDRATKLLENRKSLEERIVQARDLKKRESMHLTDGMAKTLGLRRTPRETEALARIEKLWQDNAGTKNFEDKDYEAALSDLLALAGQDRPRQQMLRSTLAVQVVRDLTRDPQRQLTYGRQFLNFLEADPPYCRPAEAHYLMMVRPETEADKPSPIDPLLEKKRWPLLKKSLEVRLLAERAALGLRQDNDDKELPAYSEQTLPWIQPTIEDADKSRRLAQDLLFTSLTARWDEADKLLDEARKGYENAQTLAVNLRRALEVSDRTLTELPYYTRWVIEQDPESAQALIDLWGRLHTLRRQVVAPPTGEVTPGQTTKLAEQAREIVGRFAKLRDSVRQAARKENPHNQDRWHEIEAILSVPFLEPEDRVTLLIASREISRDLFANPGKDGEAESISVESNGKQARTRALLNGRLALAVLGDDWPESAKIKAEIANTDEDVWHRHLTHAGASVGQLLNRLPEEADKLCEQAAKMDDLDAAATALRTAARYARTIEGAAVDARMKHDPIDEQRRLHLHRLLCWQARRTFLDWWAELKAGPDTIPYYKRAAGIFLRDAEELLTGKPATPEDAKLSKRLQQVAAMRELLRDPRKVQVEMGLSVGGSFKAGPARLDLTDEGGKERFYRLRGPDAAVVPGAPVMWVKVEPGLQAIAEEKERKTVQFGPPAAYPAKIAEDSLVERRGKQIPHHFVEGFFRGHSSRVATEVHMYRVPDVTLSLPLRQGGGNVAVQAKQSLYSLFGAENTAISLVFDISGSMNYPDEKDPNNRFHKATRALKSVLEDLPEGVMVSLRAFGAKEFNKPDDLPEKGGIRLVWKAKPWSSARTQVNRLMKQVEELTPFEYTPLLRSIRMASRDFPREVASRTVVVITDGGDSNFNDGDDDLKKTSGARTITDYLKYLKKEFDRSGIQLIVIGFDVKENQLTPKEEKSYKEFRKAMKEIGGAYHDAENVEKLQELLRRSLLRLYFRVDPEFGAPPSELGIPGGPINQTDLGEVPHYVAREQGHYLVRVPSSQRLQQRIGIGPGDALLLDLVKNPNRSAQPVFRRTLYAESDLANKLHGRERLLRAESVDRWLLAVWQNQQLRDKNSLQMMATLEKDDGIIRDQELLQQVWPEWHWFEIPAAGAKDPMPPLRMDRVSNYPAPTWGIDLPRWAPWGAPVTLKAWWREKLPPPHGKLVKGPEFQSPFELVNRSWPSDAPPGTVLLESVKVETHRLKAVEGGREEPVECLMIRLSYPAETGPFFVRWPGWEGGQEHRFYRDAGKYTGIFWSTARDMKEVAEKELKRLDLYSVGQLKEGALRVKELKVGTPNDVWERPTPAPSIRHRP